MVGPVGAGRATASAIRSRCSTRYWPPQEHAPLPVETHQVELQTDINGLLLDGWLPTPSVRDTLVDLMRELIRLHHRERHGMVGPEAQASLPGAA